MASLIIIIALFALLWFLMIRPQRARQQKQKEMLDSVTPGDEVLTVGGLYGIVQELDEDEDVIVEIAEGIHVRIARRAISAVVKPEDDEEEQGTFDEDAEPADAIDEERVDPETEDAAALDRR